MYRALLRRSEVDTLFYADDYWTCAQRSHTKRTVSGKYTVDCRLHLGETCIPIGIRTKKYLSLSSCRRQHRRDRMGQDRP